MGLTRLYMIFIIYNILLVIVLSLTSSTLTTSLIIPSYFHNNNNNNNNMNRLSYSIRKRISSPTSSYQRANQRATLLNSNSNSNNNIKVVTDIDDTVKSSGGVKLLGIPLGGIDTQYKRGDFYPGVSQFMLELSRPRSKQTKAINNISVLTARAKEFKFALALKPKDKICTAFRNLGNSNGFNGWGIGDVYYGSVVEWIFQDRKAIRKLNNFEIMINNDDNNNNKGSLSNYIFIGDTGELDEDGSERIALKYPNRLKAVFLHTVSDNTDRSKIIMKKDRLFNKIPFFYFQTYVGAAAKAFEAKLISEAGLQNVINQATKELNSKFPKNNNNAQSSKWIELEKDIAFAMKAKKIKGRGLDGYINQDDLMANVDKLLKIRTW